MELGADNTQNDDEEKLDQLAANDCKLFHTILLPFFFRCVSLDEKYDTIVPEAGWYRT
jgi:hypothetical protein